MREVAIVINARVSSSRCPRKLVRPFASTTLLDIALEKLSKIKVDEKYLAAGDREILDIYHSNYSSKIGLLKRDEDSIAPGEHDHTVSFRHYKFTKSKYILIMNPCLPMTSIDTYNKAIAYFQDNDHIDTLTSVVTYQDIFFDDKGNNTLKNIHHISSTTANKLYKMAHVFHIVNRDTFFERGRFWSYQIDDPAIMQVPKYECFDVDDEEDFEFCSTLYYGQGRIL